MFNKKNLVLLLIVLNAFRFLNAQDGLKYQANDSSKQYLQKGLQQMIHLLKTGEKDSALVWFRNNYYSLHQHKLLDDSVLLKMAFDIKSTISTDHNTITETDSGIVEKQLHTFIADEIRMIANKLGENPGKILPEDFVKDVEKYIKLFTENSKYHQFFQNSINRSRKYIPLFREHFTSKGFPEEILYFIIIESGFDPNAISKAGAAGMFQFMEGTAKQYGLTVDKKIDERFSAIRSAEAAAAYLKDLYLELGSINLALSSYNSGSGKTRRALKELENLQERNFWAIRSKSPSLKEETREYIPQIFAAIVIAKPENTNKFGFDDAPFPDESAYNVIFTPKALEITEFLESCDIDKKSFFKLNPDISHTAIYTPSNIIDYPIYIPADKSGEVKTYLTDKFGQADFFKYQEVSLIFRDSITKNKKDKKTNKTKPKPVFDVNYVIEKQELKAGDRFKYNVQRANTLNLVARIFDVPVDSIITWNNLKFKSIKRGQVLEIVASRDLVLYTYEVPKQTTFRRIAAEFNVDYNFLKNTNPGIHESITRGQILKVYSFK